MEEEFAAAVRDPELIGSLGFGSESLEGYLYPETYRLPRGLTAAAIARVADGVVVGSAIVDIVAQHGTSAAGPVRDYIRTLSAAIATARQTMNA